ncbi:UNVERIFIED_ORG: hypothetical protein B2H95_05670 [Clostridium botulinum]|uniref:hypothetical protein n=1 Tax=Clostridium sp. ZBS15 TaxID=2949969 RepID=UPI000A171F7D|nr:hypothetical protein [Clostridium sp. ZBS15]
MSLISSIGSFVGGICSSICSVASNIGGGLSGFVAKVFDPVIFHTIEAIEIAIKVIGAAIGALAEALGLTKEETPEEIGMKAEEAEKEGIKPENFDSYSEYIDHLRNNIEIDKDKLDNLSREDKLKYTALGSSILVKGIEENKNMEIPAEFITQIAKQNLEVDEVRAYIDSFKENGLNLRDFNSYLDGSLNDNKYEKVGNIIENTIKTLNPEMSENEIGQKIDDMRNNSR